MAVLSETLSFPVWAAALSAAATVLVAVLIRPLDAKRQVAAVMGIALLAVAAILGPALLRPGAGPPDRPGALAVDEIAAERHALERRHAQLRVHAAAPGSTLACLEALAGEPVETACERSVFASPRSTAVAVSYAAAQWRLLADGVAFARRSDPTYLPRLSGLRRAVENDAYGIYAHVLATDDGCTAERCEAFALLQDASTLKLHLRQRLYAVTIARHRERWKMHEAPSASVPMMARGEPVALTAARATPVLAASSSVSAAAGTVPLPRTRPGLVAQLDSSSDTMSPAAPGPSVRRPMRALSSAASTSAPSLWIASAAVAVAGVRVGESADAPAGSTDLSALVDASPTAVEGPPADSGDAEKSIAAGPVAEGQRTAGGPATIDSPAATAYAARERERGVIPPIASVLTHLEYPSASSIPPISIMAEEPKLPAQPVPSTAPMPPSRPQ